MLPRLTLAALLGASVLSAVPAAAAPGDPLSTRGSFRIGSDGVLCSAQYQLDDTRLTDMFDRAYRLTCRDAAAPVGTALALRGTTELGYAMPGQVCATEAAEEIAGIGQVRSMTCRDEKASVDFRRYAVSRGRIFYLVEGLAGYDVVLRLALASLVNDRQQTGTVRVATTLVSDPASFARVQAGNMESGGVRTEGYLRNNGGRFAESAEFFGSLASRERDDAVTLAEAYANQGLQHSNLGNHAAANLLFDRAQTLISRDDPVLRRLLRNYRAIAELNRREPAAALAQLSAPVPEVDKTEKVNALRNGLINEPISLDLNRDSADARKLRAMDSQLTPGERAEILDAQALGLNGTAHRQQGRLDEASREFGRAAARIRAVRGGRVTSATWLLADIAMEQALTDERRGDREAAKRGFDRAIAALAEAFPNSPAWLSARARKAALISRLGERDAALTEFAAVVAASADVPDGGSALRYLLGPYFELLAERSGPEDAAAMFSAAQARQRPGVAQTQAVLARQFSEGSDEASALFRLALTRTREIARGEQELAILRAKPERSAADAEAIEGTERSLAALRQEQTNIQSRLAAFPRYQALTRAGVDLAELRQQLRPGEAYWQLIDGGSGVYALFATAAGARIYRTGTSRSALEADVRAVRDSIARSDQGQIVTDPFDLARSSQLFGRLMGPIAADLRGINHLVVEPDGPLLQLPLAVLVTDPANVTAYQARMQQPNADEYDLRDVAWLGRGRQITTAVSPRSFLDVRAVPASRATRAYLGLGGNALPEARPVVAATDECEWPLAAWQAPISTAELTIGRDRFGAERSSLITGADFTDTGLLNGQDLSDYRVVHFATHGLVTAPRPGCPPRPALLTSFGAAGSDGLLSFREIFDLKLDADLVILSACDTAGLATVGASREAGLSDGGNYALDGLVRAFVGAGARSVVASHWPVPDDFDATKRLMTGLLGAAPGQGVAEALRVAQQGLMDDPQTSHPFYWAAFIILGDGTKPLVPANLAEAGGGAAKRGR